jgi:hypothetical protein
LIAEHFLCHVILKIHVNPVATMIGQKLPDDLAEKLAVPVWWFILRADMEILDVPFLLNGLTEPEHLAAIVADKVAIDAQCYAP